jgi:hypothetical protein
MSDGIVEGGLVTVLRRDVGMKCKVHLLEHEHEHGYG